MKSMGAEEYPAKEISEKYRLPYLEIETKDLDPSLLKYVNFDFCNSYKVLPIGKKGRCLILAMVHPDIKVIDDIKFTTGLETAIGIIEEENMNSLLGYIKNC